MAIAMLTYLIHIVATIFRILSTQHKLHELGLQPSFKERRLFIFSGLLLVLHLFLSSGLFYWSLILGNIESNLRAYELNNLVPNLNRSVRSVMIS